MIDYKKMYQKDDEMTALQLAGEFVSLLVIIFVIFAAFWIVDDGDYVKTTPVSKDQLHQLTTEQLKASTVELNQYFEARARK